MEYIPIDIFNIITSYLSAKCSCNLLSTNKLIYTKLLNGGLTDVYIHSHTLTDIMLKNYLENYYYW